MKRISHDLPEHILEEIAVRLPFESLKSFKHVCKSWYAMINNPSFIKKHLQVSMQNNKPSSPITLYFGSCCHDFIAGNKKLSRKQVFYLLTIRKHNVVGNRLPCIVEEISFPPIPEAEEMDFPKFLAATHCNGIICFYGCFPDPKTTVVLCNMELGEFKLLRTPSPPPMFRVSRFGFGYDPKGDDYKLVKVFSTAGFEKRSRAQVYTLGTNSWREIDLKGIYCWLDKDGVYCKGSYYWWNYGLQGSRKTVLSLDMSEEKFCSIQLPTIAQMPNEKLTRLMTWNELVAFFVCTNMPDYASWFELWVMVRDFNGVEGFTYWNKHLTIGPVIRICKPLAFSKEDELLMQTRDSGIVSYNLRTHKLKELPVPRWIVPYANCVFPCLKTLVSMKREICMVKR